MTARRYRIRLRSLVVAGLALAGVLLALARRRRRPPEKGAATTAAPAPAPSRPPDGPGPEPAPYVRADELPPAAPAPAAPAPAPPPARRRERSGNVAVGAAALLAAGALLALGGWGLVVALGDDGSAPAGVTAPATSTAPTAQPVPSATPSPAPVAAGGEQEWTLLAGGDVLMDLSELLAFDPFAGIQPPLASGDLALVNVEMSIATSGEPADKSFVFRAPPSAADKMSAAGIDAGNLGNNHSLDFGAGALLETVANLRRAGVAPVGAGTNAAQAYAPASFDIAGQRVAVLGASRVFPEPDWAAREGPGLASAYDEATLLAAVRAARASHDVVIVTVHWGVENAPCPDEDQSRLGDALLGAGASVVLGSHPHVLQPLVRRPNGLIAYSLGNFVWHPRSGPSGETGVLEVRFRGAQIVDFRLHPHVLDRAGAPVPAGPAAAPRITAAITNPCLPPTPTPTPSATATPTVE